MKEAEERSPQTHFFFVPPELKRMSLSERVRQRRSCVIKTYSHLQRRRCQAAAIRTFELWVKMRFLSQKKLKEPNNREVENDGSQSTVCAQFPFDSGFLLCVLHTIQLL